MYHKATITTRAYYDTVSEMPNTAKVYFPKEDNRPMEEMTVEQMMELSDKGYHTIVHSVNFGCCDHWYSVPLSRWVQEYFMQIIHYTDQKGDTVGYDRKDWSVLLTYDADYRKSDVWNS